ncbi:MAG: FitA-like ribbon-helix-helix domain-containing protein [Tagaea sp.]
MKVTARKKPGKTRKTVTLTIRRLEPELGAQLRTTARARGLSVEEHVRRTLRATHPSTAPGESWVERFRRDWLAATDGQGIDLDLPPRPITREPPDFSNV